MTTGYTPRPADLGPGVHVPLSLFFSPPLRSAHITAHGSEPPATTHVGPPENFHDTLDYIFATRGLAPVATLALPTAEEGLGGFPNATQPSDHAPIGAQYEIQY